MMEGAPFRSAFSWYGERTHHAFPPKSIFVVLLLMMLAIAVPAAGFWLLGQYPALEWLGSMAAILFGCLVVDLMLTHQRYKAWAGEWLCGDCKHVFKPKSVWIETPMPVCK